MHELIKRLDKLFLKLDHTALLVEQSIADVIEVVLSGNQADAIAVIESDEEIDRREVEIERECIRLLALYQPAAIDLRRICFIIKVNSDLERIADLCVSIAKMQLRMYEHDASIHSILSFRKLADTASATYRKTIQLLAPQRDGNTDNLAFAESIIQGDPENDAAFKDYLAEVLNEASPFKGNTDAIYALTSLGRSFERIGDLCCDIAEDAIFLETGEIVRHRR